MKRIYKVTVRLTQKEREALRRHVQSTGLSQEEYLRTLGGKEAEATILDKVGDNKYIAEYNGVKCTAIFNPFVGKFYVDNIYGIIRDTPPERGEITR